MDAILFPWRKKTTTKYYTFSTSTIRAASGETLFLDFSTRSDTNRAVQPQKMERVLIVRTICVPKPKVLISCLVNTADIAPLISHIQNQGFLITRLNYIIRQTNVLRLYSYEYVYSIVQNDWKLMFPKHLIFPIPKHLKYITMYVGVELLAIIISFCISQEGFTRLAQFVVQQCVRMFDSRVHHILSPVVSYW